MSRSASLAFLFITLVATPFANADYFINVGSGVFNSDGVNPTTGSVNVFVSSNNPATDFPGGIGPQISGYQTAIQAGSFTGSIASVGFQAASISGAPNTALFPSTPFTVSLAGPYSVANSFSDFGLNPSLFNNAGLFRLNFSVPAGQSGSFVLSFLDTPGASSELNNTSFADIANGFNSGTITINAVPEPTSIALLVSGCLGMVLRRRRVV